MNIEISVIMPSLNVALYIEECMRSVLLQTLYNIEILCVDAGSTDGTLDILERFAEQDSRIGHDGNIGSFLNKDLNII